ncbi:caspase family protein [Micromonospora sp. SL4-19]|uniref:caspase family protein n=1 Tax=Micromonospora sp. SL4-19 TaxID=3399129 RepID=UPI003A4D98F0
MARRIAVAIGVKSVPDLVPLPGAVNGVAEFTSWARQQGFEVEEITDFGGEPVRLASIYRVIDKAARARDVQQLFVYFAGHGVTLGLGADLWLLSEARDNPNEAVNVRLSQRHAQQSGIPHVVLFADACRSPAGKAELDVIGGSIFPAIRSVALVSVDEFYATRAGNAAMEKIPDGQAAKAFGIFSRCLMAALRGDAPGAVVEVAGGLSSRAVLATTLRDYLEEAVRDLASREANVLQIPECVPMSKWEPNVVSWLRDPPTAEPEAGDGSSKKEPDRQRVRNSGDAESTWLWGPGEDVAWAGPAEGGTGEDPGWAGPGETDAGPARAPDVPGEVEPASTAHEPTHLAEQQFVEEVANHYASSIGRANFETRAGASVVGAEVARVEAADSSSFLFQETGAWHLRGAGGPAAVLLRLFPDQERPGFTGWTGTALLPGYVGTLTVGSQGVEHLGYLPVDNNRLPLEEMRRVVARAGADDHVGRFDPDSRDESLRVALHELLNPTLVVLAAYYYDRRGRQDDLESLLRRVSLRGYVPFDLVLLADRTPAELNVAVVPCFPLMSRGWALLDGSGTPVPGVLRAARRLLLPSPWTTFRRMNDDLAYELARLSPSAFESPRAPN